MLSIVDSVYIYPDIDEIMKFNENEKDGTCVLWGLCSSNYMGTKQSDINFTLLLSLVTCLNEEKITFLLLSEFEIYYKT